MDSVVLRVDKPERHPAHRVTRIGDAADRLGVFAGLAVESQGARGRCCHTESVGKAEA